MKEDCLEEGLVSALRDSFYAAMRLQPDEFIPEAVYAVLEALIEYAGTDRIKLIEDALGECIVAACGSADDVH